VDSYLRPFRAARDAMSRPANLNLHRVVAALVACMLGATLLSISGSATALDGRRIGPLDNRGFPSYYVDSVGRGVQMCDNGTAFCQGVRAGALTPPEGEAFYWSALAPIRTGRGTLDVEFALEAAFAGQRPIVFSRLRIRGHLDRRGLYTLHHPFGNVKFRATRPAQDRNVNMTIDRPCSITRGTCAPRMPTWLRARNQHKGYLGALRRTRVTGGTFRNNMSVEAEHHRIIGRTARFRVIGKLCGPDCRARMRRAAR
jgi:hypothetical protein